MSVKKTASCQIALLILLSLLMVLVLSACVNTPGAEDAQAQISIRFAAEITDCGVPASHPWAYHSYYANPMGGHTQSGIYAWFNNGQRQTEGKAAKDYGLCYDDPTVWRTE